MTQGPNRPAWRALDVFASAGGLVLLSPFLCVITIAIRGADGSPVLFRQRRTGRDGAEFTVLKFRTMTIASADADGVTVANDVRVTRMGARLRRYKLDELPQLVNVLRGEMSVVGPRPDVPSVVASLTGEARRVLDYRPGISCRTTLTFDSETELMAESSDPAGYYVRVLAPLKAICAAEEMRDANIWAFFKTVVLTLRPGRRADGLAELRNLVAQRAVLPDAWRP